MQGSGFFTVCSPPRACLKEPHRVRADSSWPACPQATIRLPHTVSVGSNSAATILCRTCVTQNYNDGNNSDMDCDDSLCYVCRLVLCCLHALLKIGIDLRLCILGCVLLTLEVGVCMAVAAKVMTESDLYTASILFLYVAKAKPKKLESAGSFRAQSASTMCCKGLCCKGLCTALRSRAYLQSIINSPRI